jgi:Uma2 family endonuclease
MAENWLRTVFASELYVVRSHEALPGEPDEHPHDLAVFHAHPRNDSEQVPVLVLDFEDADTGYDLAEHASRNAAYGVRDYWVLDVVARKLHVFRDPRPDASAPHGFSYARVVVNSPYALVSPLVAELHLAQVINLLP